MVSAKYAYIYILGGKGRLKYLLYFYSTASEVYNISTNFHQNNFSNIYNNNSYIENYKRNKWNYDNFNQKNLILKFMINKYTCLVLKATFTFSKMVNFLMHIRHI